MFSTRYRILVVDDEVYMGQAIRMTLERINYQVDLAHTAEEALQILAISGREYALIIMDRNLGKSSGVQLVRAIRRFNDESIIVFHSGDTSTEAVREAFQVGAVDYLQKGLPSDEFITAIRDYCRKYEETSRTLKQNEPSSNEQYLSTFGLVGRSNAMMEVAVQAARYRNSKDPVLVFGETGTGKELIARALHQGSPDTFLVVNCATYQGNTHLLESELFGYEKGAFTGASTMGKVGLLEAARGGTVFLDEIHRLSLEAQGKLLRVLQEKKIRRVGGTKEYPIDFRLISAGKSELEKAMNDGEFLPDLYYRLNVLNIQVPLLKDRKEDIEPLVWFFTDRFCKKNDTKKTFLMKTIRFLENYSWPGNVRELENTVTRLLTDSQQKTVDPKQLEAKFFHEPEATDESFISIEQRHERERREYLFAALEKNGWNRTQTAREIGIPASRLYDLMSKYRIDRPDPREAS